MGELQARLKKDGSEARLVSFSVDPENDTPPVLAAYGAKAGAELGRWTFVTGSVNDIAAAVVQAQQVAARTVNRVVDAGDFRQAHGVACGQVLAKGLRQGGDLHQIRSLTAVQRVVNLFGAIGRLFSAQSLTDIGEFHPHQWLRHPSASLADWRQVSGSDAEVLQKK